MPHFTTTDGTRLFYTDEGDGAPLLCLPGLTRTGTDFDYVAPHLTDRRLIRPTYRGRGESAWADPATYTVPQEAKDVLELLDHLGLERVPVLGTSRGGLIAMLLGVTAADRLSGICLNDIGPHIDAEGLAEIEGYIGRNPRLPDLESVAAKIAEYNAHRFHDVPEGRWLEDAQRHFRMGADGPEITYDPALAQAFAESEGAPDLWPLWAQLPQVPLALIHGATSNLLSDATAARMQAERPDMIYAKVPGRAHIPWLDEAESVAAIRSWLERVSA